MCLPSTLPPQRPAPHPSPTFTSFLRRQRFCRCAVQSVLPLLLIPHGFPLFSHCCRPPVLPSPPFTARPPKTPQHFPGTPDDFLTTVAPLSTTRPPLSTKTSCFGLQRLCRCHHFSIIYQPKQVIFLTRHYPVSVIFLLCRLHKQELAKRKR